jgi:hypothetical protein
MTDKIQGQPVGVPFPDYLVPVTLGPIDLKLRAEVKATIIFPDPKSKAVIDHLVKTILGMTGAWAATALQLMLEGMKHEIDPSETLREALAVLDMNRRALVARGMMIQEGKDPHSRVVTASPKDVPPAETRVVVP